LKARRAGNRRSSRADFANWLALPPAQAQLRRFSRRRNWRILVIAISLGAPSFSQFYRGKGGMPTELGSTPFQKKLYREGQRSPRDSFVLIDSALNECIKISHSFRKNAE
jgi:hypothetical protein